MVPITHMLLSIPTIFYRESSNYCFLFYRSVLSSKVPLKMARCFAREAAELTMIPPYHVFSSGAIVDYRIVCKKSCTDHIYRAFLQCACACVLSSDQLERKNSRTGHIYGAFLQCACACVASKHLPQ